MIFSIVRSMFILGTVGATVAFLFSNDGLSFTKVFLFALLMQVILYNIYETIREYLFEKIENERIKEFSKQEWKLNVHVIKK